MTPTESPWIAYSVRKPTAADADKSSCILMMRSEILTPWPGRWDGDYRDIEKVLFWMRIPPLPAPPKPSRRELDDKAYYEWTHITKTPRGAGPDIWHGGRQELRREVRELQELWVLSRIDDERFHNQLAELVKEDDGK